MHLNALLFITFIMQNMGLKLKEEEEEQQKNKKKKKEK